MSDLFDAMLSLFKARPTKAKKELIDKAASATQYLDKQNQEASRLTRELQHLEASLTTPGKGPAK